MRVKVLLVTGLAGLILAGMGALILGMAAAPPSPAKTPDQVIAEADKLADQEKFEDSNKLLMDLAKTAPNHPDVYWKIAKNYYDLGERIPIAQKDKKLAMYKNCETWAANGYAKNPNLADNSFWLAVGLSQQAQTNGITNTIISDRTLPKRIEDYYLKCTQAKEFHYKTDNTNTIASAHMALGVFYRKIPDSSIIKLVIGTKGDLDKSVSHSQTAVKMFGNNMEFAKELGVSYLCRGTTNKNQKDIDEGKKWLTQVTKMPAKDQLDKVDQADAKRLIADPSLGCGYSRVQQEVVSDKAFK